MLYRLLTVGRIVHQKNMPAYAFVGLPAHAAISEAII